MKNYLIILFGLLFLSACETDKNSLAFIITDENAEIAEVSLTTKQAGAPFYYLLLAEQLIINWGDGSRLAEYQYPSNNENWWTTIKPIQHNYSNAGNYNLNIRTYRPNVFNFSNTDSLAAFVDINKLTLKNCFSLKGLYLRKQSLTDLDLTNAENLEILNIENSNISNLTTRKVLTRLTSLFIDSTQISSFDCSLTPNIQALSIGSLSNQQDIQNIDSLHSLGALAIRGTIKQTHFSAIKNDSLQIFSATNANITQIDLSNLQFLNTINISSCNQLSNVILAKNNSLTSLTLTNNKLFTAEVLNRIFRALPTTSNKGSILLRDNEGDATCDKSIATKKGWVFK